MTTKPFLFETPKNVTLLGMRAGAIKPSTGYAFATMLQHAKDICVNIHEPVVTIQRNRRFQFYDTLLIDILSKYPEQGNIIFSQLFQHQSITRVLTFLQESTSLRTELQIFSHLPWKPFLYSVYRNTKYKKEMITFVSVLVYICSSFYIPDIANLTFGMALVGGLLVIGIPHGSIDHMVIGANGVRLTNPLFISAYLFVMLAIGVCWMLYPMLAFIIFLFSSAWHFGQTDFVHWKIQKPFYSIFLTLTEYHNQPLSL